jgi:hypothetical protein
MQQIESAKKTFTSFLNNYFSHLKNAHQTIEKWKINVFYGGNTHV